MGDENEKIPMLPKKVLTEKLNIAVGKDLKALWDELKREGIDVPEVARRLLSRELSKLKGRAA